MAKSPRGKAATQPHDGLVKWTFSQREHAIGLLKAALPKAVVEATDWSTLRVEKGSFVDRALRHRHSDIVLSARMDGEPVFFYTLIEHQRTVEALMIFRMGLYMWRLWEQLVRDRPRRKTLPPIVPLLLHQSDSGWTAATRFQDVIAWKGLGTASGLRPSASAARAAMEEHVPHFALRLVDLSEGRASHLAEQALTSLGRLVLRCMSVADDDERLQREIGRMGEAIAEAVTAPNGLAALEVLLRYLVATHARLRASRVGELLMKAADPVAQEEIVDFIEQFKREGKAEGRAEGKAEVLLEQLAARFGRLPAAVKSRVRASSEEELSACALRVLTAPTLAEVLDGAQRPRASTRPANARNPAAPKRTGSPRK